MHSLANLAVFVIPQEQSQALATLVSRAMRLQATIEEGQVWFGDENQTLTITPQELKAWA